MLSGRQQAVALCGLRLPEQMRKDVLGSKLVSGLEQESPGAGGHKLGSVTRLRFPPLASSVMWGEVFRRAFREFSKY